MVMYGSVETFMFFELGRFEFGNTIVETWVKQLDYLQDFCAVSKKLEDCSCSQRQIWQIPYVQYRS